VIPFTIALQEANQFKVDRSNDFFTTPTTTTTTTTTTTAKQATL
jgi:hypothetical protein